MSAREAGEFCPVVAGGDSVGARRRDGGCRARGEFTAPGASNCLWHFPRAALRLRWAIFDRSLRDGEAIWPVCERAPVGDGEINLTFMRLPCWRGAEVPARRVTHFRNFKEQESSKKPVAR